MHCDVSCPLQYRQKHAFSMYTNYILGRSSADNWMPQAKVFFEVGTDGARGQPSHLANPPPFTPQARRRMLGDKIELQSYVIAPVQRFTKYKLLLRVRPCISALGRAQTPASCSAGHSQVYPKRWGGCCQGGGGIPIDDHPATGGQRHCVHQHDQGPPGRWGLWAGLVGGLQWSPGLCCLPPVE